VFGQLCGSYLSKDHCRYGYKIDKAIGRLDEALLHEIQATQAPAQKYNYKDGQYCLEDICHEKFLPGTEAHLSFLGQKAQGTRHKARGEFIEYGSQ
jgi:hypothetical protein